MHVTWLANLIGFDQSLLQLAKMIDIIELFSGFKWGPLLVNCGIDPLGLVVLEQDTKFFFLKKERKREKMIDITVYSLMNFF